MTDVIQLHQTPEYSSIEENDEGVHVPGKKKQESQVQFYTGGVPLQFRGGDLMPAIKARGTPYSLVAKRDLERYYLMLDRNLRTVSLTELEAETICEALCSGDWLTNATSHYTYAWAEVDEWFRTRERKKSKLDEAGLVEKMRSWSPCQTLAVVDAVERYSIDKKLTMRELGLVRA